MLVLVACIALAMGGVRWLFVGEPPGWYKILLVIFDADDTIYAPGYSERRFDELRVGMPAREVERALGPPIEWMQYSPEEDEIWLYSKSPRGWSFYRRWVRVKDGRVTWISDDYYYD